MPWCGGNCTWQQRKRKDAQSGGDRAARSLRTHSCVSLRDPLPALVNATNDGVNVATTQPEVCFWAHLLPRPISFSPDPRPRRASIVSLKEPDCQGVKADLNPIGRLIRRKPTFPVPRWLAARESRVCLRGVGRFLLDAGAMSQRGLVHRVTAPVRARR